MRCRRRHRCNGTNRSEAKENPRRKIWEDPTIIEEMFNDTEWRRYEQAADDFAPSKKMAQHIESEIDRDERQILRREIRLRRSNHMIQVGIVAALLLFISFQLWQQSQRVEQPAALHYAQQDSARVAVPRWVSIFNDGDQIDTVHLPDQSTVHLFAQSSLRYGDDFAVAARDIYLEGKAFFGVEKDTKRPFSVYAGATKTTALGTSFTIDIRREKQHTVVELHNGKIVVASTADIPAFENIILDRKGANLLLDADMQIVRPEPERKEKPARLAETAAPTQTGSQLYMENIPLPDVFATLEEAYQTDIHIQDEHIRTIQYTGIIDPEKESLVDVLTVICLINDLHYDTHEDGSFHIYFRKR